MTTTSGSSELPVSLVTGANKGIGLETVRRLVGAGHRVYLGARDAERGRAAADAAGAEFVQLDVTSDDSVGRAADIVERAEGHLDVLVNNAGITGPVRDVHEYEGDDMAAVLLTNVVGYVCVIHAFLPLLERSSDPRIVNVSSGLGSFALAHDQSRMESRAPSPLYAAAKSAINMLTVRYAQLLPEIRINVADPGLTATDLSSGHGHSVKSGTDAIVAFALLLHAGPGTTQTQIMIDAARDGGVNRIVLLSSIGARLIPNPMIGSILAAREDLLRASGLDVTYLRPNGLMSNALQWADGIRENNRVVDPTDPGRQPVVDPDDIARVAALVLTQDGHVGHGYILNGPEALTAREEVHTLSDVLGHNIDFVAVTPEQAAKEAIENGTPAQLAAAMQNLNELFRAGRAGVIADDIENLTGVAPRTFRDWCERHADKFRSDTTHNPQMASLTA